MTQSNKFYTPELMYDRSPINWVDKIQVPTFLACAWQDEQTGPGFAAMLDRIPNRPDVKITLVNGVHASALEPRTLWNWLAFLDLYVAKRVPDPGRLSPIAPIIYSSILDAGQPVPPLPADRFDGIIQLRDGVGAVRVRPAHPRADGERRRLGPAGHPRAHVRAGLPEVAAARGEGHPVVVRSGRYPRARNPRGAEGGRAIGPTRMRARSRRFLATARPTRGPSCRRTTGAPIQTARRRPGRLRRSTTTSPSSGPAASTCRCARARSDTDLQVTLTEIRPDGKETYVQSGWLRASMRALDQEAVDAPGPFADASSRARRARFPRGASPASACRLRPCRTSSAPARASGSAWRPPAAIAPAGASTR